MKIKVERSSKKTKDNAQNTFGNIIDKLSPNKRRDIAHFLTINNYNRTIMLAQSQLHSNPGVIIEAERQQCNGLLYASITRFR